MKGRIKQLFLNYCDFSIDSGKTYLTYTHFLKVIKDAKIIDNCKVT